MNSDQQMIVMWVLCLLNVPVFLLIGKKMFNSWRGFLKELKVATSTLHDKVAQEDQVNNFYDRTPAQYKILGFVLICSVAVIIEFFLVWFVM